MNKVAESKSRKVKKSKSIPLEAVFNAREEIHNIHVSENVEKYIVDLITATRRSERYSEELGW